MLIRLLKLSCTLFRQMHVVFHQPSDLLPPHFHLPDTMAIAASRDHGSGESPEEIKPVSLVKMRHHIKALRAPSCDTSRSSISICCCCMRTSSTQEESRNSLNFSCNCIISSSAFRLTS